MMTNQIQGIMNRETDNYIEEATAEQKEIMTVIRKLIHDAVSEVEEQFKWSRPVFSKGKDFAYLKTAKTHVTLGFMDFHKIHDPHGLLEGTGKDMRHIKIKRITDINADMLKEWFEAVSK